MLQHEDNWQEIDHTDLRSRARSSLSARPRPFLRWAGSKRALLPDLVEVLPSRFRTYREPFLGGGSLFFLLRPQRAVLGDCLQELMETYAAVRDRAPAVEKYLRRWRPDRAFFDAVRATPSRGRYRRAAEFIYLNKTCWNGLYRVNQQGRFNVPYGLPKSDRLIDPANLISCQEVLSARGVELRTGDFEVLLSGAEAGDLVFLDPPYARRKNGDRKAFVDYSRSLFSMEDQGRLARVAQQLRAIGCTVVVANTCDEEVIDLFQGFQVKQVVRHSTIAGRSASRQPVAEAIFF